jgi:glutamate-1-semialdehyde 2,1-aminomutase
MSSSELFSRAVARIPGGVNSPVRAFGAVGGDPVYMKSGKGARMTSVDGDEYLDFCGSWGPLVLGHGHPAVKKAVRHAAKKGLSFGTNTPGEVEMAELVCELIPSLDMVRLVNSGTEAMMTALRLARGVTGREGVIKFDGCYHGHSDNFLVAAGSGLLTGGIASCAGVPNAAVESVMLAPYNDLDAVRAIVGEHGSKLAAICVEPIAGNMGLIPPGPGFLEGLRELASECGALLIFDEVITGFRLGPTTYGNRVGVTPDITCLGKIIGGGMPIGALGASREIMEHLAPLGSVYQAGTLSGNPVAVAAGLATLRTLRDHNPYPEIARLGERLADGVNTIAKSRGESIHCARRGGMFTVFFGNGPLRNLDDVKNNCSTDRFAAYYRAMLDRGVYMSPSQFEVSFVSAAHTDADIDEMLSAFDSALDVI